MDEADVTKLIKYAAALGLDPGKVLHWRLNFEPKPNRHIDRPRGMLSMRDARNKFGISQVYLSELRREHGLPVTRKANLILVDERTLKEWLRKFPAANPTHKQRASNR